MTQRFVSKEIGNDSYDGLTPSTAKATFIAGINACVAGDTLFVDPSSKGWEVYAENLTWASAVSGSSGSPITVTADVDGTYFGNREYVAITDCSDDWNSVTDTSHSSYGVVTMTNKDYWTFNNIIFYIVNTTLGGGWTWSGCNFHIYNECDFEFHGVRGYHPSTATDNSWYKCMFTWMGFAVFGASSGGSHQRCLFERCVLLGDVAWVSAGGAGANVTYRHCQYLSGSTFSATNANTYNCITLNTGVSPSQVTGVTAYVDCPHFWSFATRLRVDKTPTSAFPFATQTFSPYASVGNNANIPADGNDVFGIKLVLGSDTGGTTNGLAQSSLARLDTTGQIEGNNSCKISGANYYYGYIYVNANKVVTISSKCKFDTTYNGSNTSLPKLRVLAGCGTAEKSDTHSGGAGTIDTLQVTTDTLTSTGWLKVVVEAYGSLASAHAWFDDVVYSEA